MTTYEIGTELPPLLMRLAHSLEAHRDELCERVAARHLAAFPELERSLRNLAGESPQQRLRAVAVDRFHSLVVAVLTVGLLSLAEQEYRWCASILPRFGVRQQHNIALVRAYLAEARALPLDPEEDDALAALAAALIGIIQKHYPER